MKSSFSLPSRNVLRGDFQRCFAYDGMKRMGVIERYQCGIFERIYGWFDGIGIRYSVSPEVEGCMMHSEGRCFREIMFSVDSNQEDHRRSSTKCLRVRYPDAGWNERKPAASQR